MKTSFFITPDYEPALHAAGLASFEALIRAPANESASRHKHRETIPLEFPVDGAPRKFFLKRVFKVPFEHSFLPMLRMQRPYSQPLREWNVLGDLHQAGIPVMRRVAVGERRRFGLPCAAVLLVEAVPMRHTLEEWLVPGFSTDRPMSQAEKELLLTELGRLVSVLHGHGFRWPDIHPKHIFAEPAESSWRFCLIDVERMTRRSRPQKPGRAALGNEAPQRADRDAIGDMRKLIEGLCPMMLTEAERACLWDGYSRRSTTLRPVSGESRTLRIRFPPPEFDAGPMPRLPDAFRHPRSETLESGHGFLATRRGRAWLESAGIRDLDDVFRQSTADALGKPGLKPHRLRQRLRVPDGTRCEKVLYLKRYLSPPPGEQLRRIRESRPRRSSAWREMHFARILGEFGIPTVQRVAYGEEMIWWWERRSFCVSEAVSGESLESLVSRLRRDDTATPSSGDRHEIIRQLALIARLLHAHRLFHRDLYLSHVFWSRNADGGIVLHLIDLARMIERPLLPRRWATKDLAALEYSAPCPLVTRADRLRFLRTYLGGRADKPTIRYHAACVRSRAGRMARHDAKRTARLQGGPPT